MEGRGRQREGDETVVTGQQGSRKVSGVSSKHKDKEPLGRGAPSGYVHLWVDFGLWQPEFLMGWFR